MKRAFRFSAVNRRTISAAFSQDIPDADRDDYVTRAAAVINSVLNDHDSLGRACAASKELHKAVDGMRAAADRMLAVFKAHPVLNQNSPLQILAVGVQQDFSRESLARLDGGEFDRPAQRRRPPQVLQTVLISNLRHAYLMGTGAAEQGCWKVIRATLSAYSRHRTGDMPKMPMLSEYAKGKARHPRPFLVARR